MNEENSGICECVYEPRGDHGLEGYQCSGKYRFKKIKSEKDNKTFFNVFPDDFLIPEYSEKCTPRLFFKYFKVISVAEAKGEI